MVQRNILERVGHRLLINVETFNALTYYRGWWIKHLLGTWFVFRNLVFSIKFSSANRAHNVGVEMLVDDLNKSIKLCSTQLSQVNRKQIKTR